MPTVSLCVIARDEAELLPGCLASVNGAAQQLIVVDTGSTDATRTIAAEHGAQVFDRPWQDDFAAARNAALAQATGDWILVLDADERLAPGAVAATSEAVARRDFDCGLLPLHNAARAEAPLDAVVSGAERAGDVVWLPRLLRRTPDLKWEGVVHENVARWLVRRGSRVRRVEAPIVHLGALPEVRERRQKAQRNVSLLERRCALEPRDLTARGYLAHELLIAEDRARARQVADEGWALRATSPDHVSLLRLGVTRALLCIEAGETDEALATLGAVESVDGPQADVAFLRGHALERVADAAHGARRARLLDAARAAYEQAVSFRERPALERLITGAASWAAFTRLGTLALARQDAAGARAAFEAAAQDRPKELEVRLGLAEAALQAGRVGPAFEAAASLLELRPDGWVLAAACALEAGAIADARQFAGHALSRRSAGFASRRREALLEQVVLELSLVDGRPTAGPGPVGLLGALSGRLPVARGAGVPDERLVRRVVSNLLAADRLALVGPWLEPRAAAVSPALPALTQRVIAELGLVAEEDGSLRWPIVVSAPEPGLAALVAEVLRAHQALAAQRTVHAAASDVVGPRREVVVFEGAAPAAADVPVDVARLLDAPVLALEALFAQLGYDSPEPPRRVLIDRYPGRRGPAQRRSAA